MVRHLNRISTLIFKVTFLMFLNGGLETTSADEPVGPPTTFIVLVDISGSMDDPFPAPIQQRLEDSSKLLDVKRRLELLADNLPASTHVIVKIFDHDAQLIFDDRLDDDATRKRLRDAFGNIKSRGGSTYLWRTLDDGLSVAREIVTDNPGKRVRVILYSDGKDEEKKLTHQDLISKHGERLLSTVRLDWICIGYDIGKDVRKALSEQGVVFTNADTPDELDPVIAKFSCESTSVVLGTPVEILDRSTGKITERTIDWGDGSKPEESNVALKSHTYNKPGTYKVTLVVKTKSGMNDQYSTDIEILLPELVPTRLDVEKTELVVEETLTAHDRSDSPATTVEWLLDGILVASDQPMLRLPVRDVGDHLLVLKRTDAWGRASREQSIIHVLPPAKPTAKLRLVAPPKHPKEPVFVVNDSSASAIHFRWMVNGKEVSNARNLEFTPEEYGPYFIELEVVDRYEQSDRAEIGVELLKPESPKVKLLRNHRWEYGLAATLSAEIAGSIDRVEWKLDGEMIRSGTESSVTLSPLEPGVHELVIRAVGPGGEMADTWTFEVPLPPKPIAKLRLLTDRRNIAIGKPLTILNESHLGLSGTWTLNGQILVSKPGVTTSDKHIELIPNTAGKFELGIEVADAYSQKATDSVVFEVPERLAPRASFTIGSDQPFAGDTIRIIDTSQGEFESVVFGIDRDGKGSERFAIDRDRTDRSFELALSAPGKVRIEQIVKGPGGESTSERIIEVASRKIAPIASFIANRMVDQGSGPIVVQFINQSEGSVDTIEFDPGDGGQMVTYAADAPIIHRYESPGEYRARIVAKSNEPGLSPSVWRSEPLRIVAPMPMWIQLGLLGTPIPSVLGILGWLSVRRKRSEEARRQASLIAGRLIANRIGSSDYQSFDFSGANSTETVGLDNKSQIRLTCNVGATPALNAELLIDHNVTDSSGFDERGVATLGGYELTYL
jgi:PKD repeat protein